VGKLAVNLSIKKLPLLSLAILLTTASLSPAQTTPSANRFVVVIDAAHGGDDSGAHLNGQLEKNFTLALSVRLRSLLAARGITVVTTRESDTNVDLSRRAEIANHANAQACLTLHASESGTGVHLFVSSLPPTAPTRLIAWKTAQSAWITRSLALAGDMNSALLHAGMTVTLGRTGLLVVDSLACPALAIEISPQRATDNASADGSEHQAAALDDLGYQARTAEALAAAILEWRTDATRSDTVPTGAAHP
jgi:N-acetylmuramoyl-L-alanine amidase